MCENNFPTINDESEDGVSPTSSKLNFNTSSSCHFHCDSAAIFAATLWSASSPACSWPWLEIKMKVPRLVDQGLLSVISRD